ncbi:MAG TPA: DMT family transporter [Vitreoscilla sp.]|nr:DMT family transporter [Vitreoscilla sp.]
MNQQQLGAVQMTTAMALSGGVGVWATWAALPSFAVVFWRCVFGFIALLAFMLFTGRIHRGWITRSQMLWSLAAGTTLVLNWVCFFQSFHYVSIGVATIVYQAQPLLVVVGGMVFFKERMGLNRWLWLGLGLMGMVLLVLARGGVSLSGDQYLLGIVLALAAASFYAAGTLVAKHMPKTPATTVTLMQVLVGIGIMLPFGVWAHVPQTSVQWMSVTMLGVVNTALMMSLVYAAISRLPTYVFAALSFVYPLVAVLLDWWVFGHMLNGWQIFATGLILLAVAGMNLNWTFSRKTKRPESPSRC